MSITYCPLCGSLVELSISGDHTPLYRERYSMLEQELKNAEARALARGAELAQRNRQLERAHELLKSAYDKLRTDEMDGPLVTLCAAILDIICPVDSITPADVEWAKQKLSEKEPLP